MNSCRRIRHAIAGARLGWVTRDEERSLERHLLDCAACRRYQEQMTAVTSLLAQKQPPPSAQLPRGFHQRFLQRLTRPASAPFADLREWMPRWLGGWSWAAAATSLVAVALVALWFAQSQPSPHLVSPPKSLESSSPPNTLSPRTSFARYHRAAEISPDELELVLNKQASRSPVGHSDRLSDLRGLLAKNALTE